AGTDLARVLQPAVLVDSHEQRPEVHGLARSLGPATDDELLLGPDLDLLPGQRSLPGQVRRAAVLRHDPLEAACLGRLEERDPVCLDVLAEADPRVRAEDIRQKPSTLLERLGE